MSIEKLPENLSPAAMVEILYEKYGLDTVDVVAVTDAPVPGRTQAVGMLAAWSEHQELLLPETPCELGDDPVENLARFIADETNLDPTKFQNASVLPEVVILDDPKYQLDEKHACLIAKVHYPDVITEDEHDYSAPTVYTPHPPEEIMGTKVFALEAAVLGEVLKACGYQSDILEASIARQKREGKRSHDAELQTDTGSPATVLNFSEFKKRRS